MHGAVHDYIVLKTVKGAESYQTGETHDRLTVGEAQKDTLIGKIKSPEEQPQFDRLLDIGSLDLIGSMRRFDFMGTNQLWPNIIGVKEYVGIDLMAGEGVDHVMNAHDLQFEDNSFDIVTCLQMLEHDDDAPQTIKEAFRVLKPYRAFYLTCASAEHPEHADLGGGSSAYIFITEDDLKEWFSDAGFDLENVEIIKDGSNFYCEAIKTDQKVVEEAKKDAEKEKNDEKPEVKEQSKNKTQSYEAAKDWLPNDTIIVDIETIADIKKDNTVSDFTGLNFAQSENKPKKSKK